MTDLQVSSSYHLGSLSVRRLGYGAMQLAGPGVFGPPRDRKGAVAVLREAIALGVDHIDTSDIYGPHVTNEIIRESLHPYRDGLVIATKVGAVRGPTGSWEPAASAADIARAVHDNLRNLGLDVLDVVDFCAMFNADGHAEAGNTPIRLYSGDIGDPTMFAELDGLVDLVLCNPPYVPEGTPVPPEVAEHDPPRAVFAEESGLAVIRHAIAAGARLLRPGGGLAIEHDDTHGSAVPALVRARRVLTGVEDHADLTGRARFVTARRLG